jgi:copper chaperone CopZ
MNQLTLTIPGLYADHHVTKVRQTLLKLSGVEEVIASAAFKQVEVDFDPETISRDAIVDALTHAGYEPGVPEIVERAPNATADPAWDVLIQRAVTTNALDLQMSGEFRKY